jgi:guanylate kinase
VNDDFDTALSEIESVVIAQRLTLKAQTTRHQTLINELLK